MTINKGVEWAAHGLAILAVVPESRALSAEALAEFHDLPPAYMAKQMQALAKAGLVTTHRGPKGGYRLSRSPEEISLLDIYLAIEGGGSMFQCTEIRQQGVCPSRRQDCKSPCGVAQGFYDAEKAFRDILKKKPLTEIIASAAAGMTPSRAAKFVNWIETSASTLQRPIGKSAGA